MVKFSQKLPENPAETPENKSLEFIPGVIVKLKLEEPCGEVKKTKVYNFSIINHIVF